jgi:hypothetical protein
MTKNLSTGEIAGIVVGGVVSLAAIFGFIYKKNKNNKVSNVKERYSPTNAETRNWNINRFEDPPKFEVPNPFSVSEITGKGISRRKKSHSNKSKSKSKSKRK